LVGEAKAEIARVQGTSRDRQELYKVAVREDGGAVREDDAEPEMLSCDDVELREGEEVILAVKEVLVWRTCSAERVTLSEGGAVATQTVSYAWSLVTSEIELNEGKYFWEVEIMSQNTSSIFVGVSAPNLNPRGRYAHRGSSSGWFIHVNSGALFGNGHHGKDKAGCYQQGDRVGVLLDLNDRSLQFFKNGVHHGVGFAAGSITGPVVHVVQVAALRPLLSPPAAFTTPLLHHSHPSSSLSPLFTLHLSTTLPLLAPPHPSSPLLTPPHPSSPLLTPPHPSSPLLTPLHPSSPLLTPPCPSTPLLTPHVA
jgi:hypothetical protein